MTRMEGFLVLASVGLAGMLVMTTCDGGTDRGWDPEESRAALFRHGNEIPRGGSENLDASKLAEHWRAPRPAPAVLHTNDPNLRPDGARTGLVALAAASTLPGCQIQPDMPGLNVVSVTLVTGGNGWNGSTCSVGGNSGTYCSVNLKPKSRPGSCSIQSKTPPGGSFCSAQPNAEVRCSTFTLQNGIVSRCSAVSVPAPPVGGDVACSTDGVGTSTLLCSVFGDQAQTCSTESLATTGTPGQANNATCSTVLSSGNSNFCSVYYPGLSPQSRSQCSAANDSGSFCSATTPPSSDGKSNDFCSITSSSSVINAQCTAFPIEQSTNCSVRPPATTKQCSVQTANPNDQPDYNPGHWCTR